MYNRIFYNYNKSHLMTLVLKLFVFCYISYFFLCIFFFFLHNSILIISYHSLSQYDPN